MVGVQEKHIGICEEKESTFLPILESDAFEEHLAHEELWQGNQSSSIKLSMAFDVDGTIVQSIASLVNFASLRPPV